MSRQYSEKVIDDIWSVNISKKEQDGLLRIYEYSVSKMSTTLAREAFFDLQDFYSARANGLTDFSFRLCKRLNEGKEQWVGLFETEGKKMEVTGRLES